jgi:predicted ester cyclase
MPLEENKRFMRHFVDEAINRKNLGAIDRLVVPNFIEHVPLPGQGPGRDGLKGAIGMFLTAFPDLAWTTDEQIAGGDKVVSRFTWTGTHRSEFLGIPPTQRSVTVWGVVIDVVKQGKFAESRIIMDTMGLMQQLGVLLGPESGG